MKKSWYSKMMKVAVMNNMYLQDAITIEREARGLRMHRRMDKPHKVMRGTPRPFCCGFVTIPVISKRTGKVLYYCMEAAQD